MGIMDQRRARSLRIVVPVVAILLVAGLVLIAILARERTAPPSASVLVWSDEFEGAAGQPPDWTKWKNDVGGTGWGNDELQYYTENSANAWLDGRSNLVIEARNDNAAGYTCHYGQCSYTSARLQTAGKFGQMYGRMEARIKVPRGTGLWPAFWMLGDDIAVHPWPASGEIDIMEHVGHEPSIVKGSAHGPGFTGANSFNRDFELPQNESFADSFHTFAVDWAPGRITWSVDGDSYGVLTPDQLSAGQQWVFDKPYFLLLNLAVGGVWPGPPDASTSFPAQLVVDYVRVYDLANVDPAQAARAHTVPGDQPGHLRGYARKCLDIKNARAEVKAPVHLWDCLDVDSQRWTLEGDQTVRLRGMCLTAGEPRAGAPIVVADCSGSGAQRFTLDPGKQALIHNDSGLCVDVAGWSTRNGASLQLWECAGTTNQRWFHTE